MSDRIDVYAKVTNRIIADLERGVRPWLKPWSNSVAEGSTIRPIRVTGEAYRGINVLMLWSEAMANGYSNPQWMTFQQAKELGGHVRKGEHGAMVVYASRFTKTETGDNGDLIERDVPFLKSYSVFNVQQIDDLPAKFYGQSVPLPEPAFQRIENAERFVSNTGALIQHGGNKAYHTMQGNNGDGFVQMPPFAAFRDAESYYGTLLHELTHWTRNPKRLNRDFGQKRFGSASYAVEELVAEIGSAFLSADLSISAEPREDHSAYIASWLEVLRNDKRAIFTAASHAQAAADYLHGLQQQQRLDVAA